MQATVGLRKTETFTRKKEKMTTYYVETSIKQRFRKAANLSFGAGILSIAASVFLFAWDTVQLSERQLSFFDTSLPLVFLLFGLVSFVLAFMNRRIAETVKLILNDDELVFYSPGLELVTTWDNIECIEDQVTLFGSQRFDSLKLRKPAKQKSSFWFQLFRRKPEQQIPMSMFGDWQSSKMGQEMKKYVPEIFGSDR